MKKAALLLTVLTALSLTSCQLISTYSVTVMPDIYYIPDSASNTSQNFYVMQTLVDLEFLDYATPNLIMGYTLQQYDVKSDDIDRVQQELLASLKDHYDAIYPKVKAYNYASLFDTTTVVNVGFTIVATWSEDDIYEVHIAI